MALGEFELIGRFFARLGAQRQDVVLGVGDDAALLQVPPDRQLVAAIDTLVAGVHFPTDHDANDIGYRALAVNLSDLAAMGATPAWALLALTLPAVDEDWLDGFALGLGDLATAHEVALVGGDTTRGPLTITVQLLGTVLPGQALRRDGAQPGDLVYVTGWPGDAAAGLACLQGRLNAQGADRAWLTTRFRRPEPRVAGGLRLTGLASSCIDVSDGLAQDLGRLAAASGVGAILRTAEVPLSRALHAAAGPGRALEFALSGGDDYELLFTVPAAKRELLRSTLAGSLPCHCIGEIVAGRGVKCIDERGNAIAAKGYDHFR
jgi:thiamine-monophosphate kinase